MKSEQTSVAVLLASGGLDSTTLAYSLLSKKIDFIPLFVNYGQHSREVELSSLRAVLPGELKERIAVVDVSSVYNGSQSRLLIEPNLWKERVVDEDLFLPHRNLLLLSIGAAFAETRGIHDVYAAFIETHRAPGRDCCVPFFDEVDRIMRQSGDVSIKLPFQGMSKIEVARLGVSLGAPIGQTFSCLAASEIPCGACPNCVDRLRALDSLFDDNATE